MTTMEPIGDWHRDEAAYDPSTQVRLAEHNGVTYQARNVTGPGFPMTVHPLTFDGRSVTVLWEDWPAAGAHFDES